MGNNDNQLGKEGIEILEVLTVCANGMGSSLILRMTVESAFRELGIDAEVEATNLSAVDGRDPDMIITTPVLAQSLGLKAGCILITISNFVDKEGIKKQIADSLAK